MHPRALLITGLLAWGCLPAPCLAAAAEGTAVEARITTILKEEALTGATWVLVTPEGVTVNAAGLKDARSDVALTATDRVHVGSVMKPVLAAGVLKLVSERRITLDAPIAELLPELSFDNPWSATHPVRLRHLLDHTAGLDDARLAQVFSLRVGADAPLGSSFSGRYSRLRVRSRPGAHFSYSNSGYTLLGMVIEKLTGERYETYLDRELLRPLGMHDSTFQFVTQEGAAADPRLAMGHFEEGVAHAAVPMYLRPSSQFTTTAADMGRFAQFLMGNGQLDGRSFIEPDLLRAMGRPHDTEAARAGLEVGYGLGMVTRDRHGVIGRCHSGNTVGFRAMLCLFPGQQRAFFVAFNTDSETAIYARVDAELIAALAIAPAGSPPVPGVMADASAWDGFYVPSPNRFATFEWLDHTFGFARLRAGERLQWQPFLSPVTELLPVRDGLWRMEGRTLASHVLLKSKEGELLLGAGSQTYRRVPLFGLILRWSSVIVGLAGAAWLLFSGLGRAAAGRLPRAHPVFLPLLGLLALLLPLPLFLGQSFLQLGDLTAASVLLAVVTALLPVTLVIGLVRNRRQRGGWVASCDAVSMLAVLQLLAVLGVAGWMPVLLWS